MPLTNRNCTPKQRAVLHKGFVSSMLKLAAPTASKRKVDSLAKGDSLLEAHLNSPAENVEAVKSLAARRGTGTLLDLPIALVRSLPPVKNKLTNEKYKDLLYSYQSRLIAADRAGGEVLAGKNKLLRSLFTESDLLPKAHVNTAAGGKIDAFVPTEVSRLSAPVDKAKRLALPILALYGVSSILDNPKKESTYRKREGDIVVHREASFDSTNTSDITRSKLIEKIATTIATLNENPTLKVETPTLVLAREKVAKAAELLKEASTTIGGLKEKLAEVSEDNKRLKLQILAKERSQRAVKLAKDMVARGMIKQAECDTQIDYIMGLDDDAFNLLKNTVSSVPIKKASLAEEGVTKLSYLIADDDTHTSEKPSLADAILQMKV